MTILRNTAEGQPSGTALTAANSGGDSGSAFYYVYKSGASIDYTNAAGAHTGTNSYAIDTSNSTTPYATFGLQPTASWVGAIQVYFYFTSYPTSGDAWIAAAVNTSSSNVLYLWLTPAGSFRLSTTSGTITATTSDTVPLNTFVRIDLQFQVNTAAPTQGTVRARACVGNSLAPFWSIGNTYANLGAQQIGSYVFGKQNSGSGALPVFYIDTVAVQDDATDFMMPYIPPIATSWMRFS